MKWFRFSIRTLVFAVALVAFDCAFALALMRRPTLGLVVGAIGVLPMANLLAIATYRSLVRGSARRPFFVGFACSGAIVVLVWLNGCLRADDKALQAFNGWFARTLERVPYLERVGTMIDDDRPLFKGIYYGSVNLSFFLSLTALPQLVIALAGGWLGARAAWVFRRRPPA